MRESDLWFAGFVGVVVAVVAAGIAIDRLRIRQMRAWAAPPVGDETTCAACGSSNIAHPLPHVYLCGDCGHEGGEGLPALERERWRTKVAGWTEEERTARGRADLDQARGLLVSAEGPLRAARGTLDAARSTLKAEHRVELLAQAAAQNHDALEDLYRAHRLIRDAAWLLTGTEIELPLSDAPPGLAPEFDWQQLAGLRDTLGQLAARLG